ncbi:MAG: hypothetical protein R2856_10530 [Caldilineaceae bacterium]
MKLQRTLFVSVAVLVVVLVLAYRAGLRALAPVVDSITAEPAGRHGCAPGRSSAGRSSGGLMAPEGALVSMAVEAAPTLDGC